MELLDYLGVARFQGPDAAGFLQAQLSADIAALEPGHASYACYCSPKGQVYGLLLVGRRENGFHVAGSSGLLPAMLERLRMFVFRSKVEFAVDESSRVYGLLPQDPPPANGAFYPGASKAGYLIADSAAAAGPGGGFKAFEIRNRIAWLDGNTTGKFIPQMLGFEHIGAVSFKKGCYPGQEIVARAHYLGKVKRGPVILSADMDGTVTNGDRVELNQGEAWVSGSVVDSARDADGSTLLFIVTSAEADSPISQLRIGDRDYRCATM